MSVINESSMVETENMIFLQAALLEDKSYNAIFKE
jgi:hypothetical protein